MLNLLEQAATPSPQRTGLPLAALLMLALLLPGCARVVTHPEIDDLVRLMDARTVILTAKYSTYSPYEAKPTERFLRLIDQELPALEKLFGFELEKRVLVHMVPAEDLNARFRETRDGRWIMRITSRSLMGYARDNEIVIYVPEALDSWPEEAQPVDYRGLIRHELAHVFLNQMDLPRLSWIHEGVAEALETYPLEGETYDIDRPFRLHPRSYYRWRPHDLAGVLSWNENGMRIEKGLETPDVRSRKLAMCLVRFLMERRGDTPFAERVVEIAAMSNAEILALEEDWRTWLRSSLRDWRRERHGRR